MQGVHGGVTRRGEVSDSRGLSRLSNPTLSEVPSVRRQAQHRSVLVADMSRNSESDHLEAGVGLPMDYLHEDSETLDSALRHCYPTQSPELSSLRGAQVLLEFARK